MAEMRVTERDKLDAINKRIHDRWFNVEDVTLDASRNVLRVPFGESRSPSKKPVKEPAVQSCLEIGNVERYTLTETEGVGRYDFNEVRFSEPNRTVTITTGIPLTFEITVGDLDVRVRDAKSEVSMR